MEKYQQAPLPFAPDALQPFISKETIEFHYNKHHKAYIDKTNDLVKGTEWEVKPLEEVITGTFRTHPKIFNQAAQAWNHTFYWQSLAPAAKGGGKLPAGKLKDAIDRDFGSFEEFKKKFSEAALAQFGSGWAWLVTNGSGALRIITTHDAETPLTTSDTPLLTCDVWEHAYYIDYRNARAKYLEGIWSVFNWEFAAANYPARQAA